MGISVIDEILTLETRYYEQFNKAPACLQMNDEHYKYLLRELGKTELKRLHGMRVEITNKVKIRILY